jgi:hypothetical protein
MHCRSYSLCLWRELLTVMPLVFRILTREANTMHWYGMEAIKHWSCTLIFLVLADLSLRSHLIFCVIL